MFSKSQLDSLLPSFLGYLEDKNCREDYLILEILHAWQSYWNIHELDLQKIFKISLSSNISTRLWNTTAYDPKSIILEFLQKDKEMVRVMFTDLFDETKNIEGRINRFVFHSNQLFSEMKSQATMKAFPSHYHDHQTLSLYLYLQFPTKYTYYEEEKYKNTLQALGARNIPIVTPIESYHKLTSILSKFILQDEKVNNFLISSSEKRKINYLPSNGIANIFFDFILFSQQKNQQKNNQ
jgi:predicted RNA-binding protein